MVVAFSCFNLEVSGNHSRFPEFKDFFEFHLLNIFLSFIYNFGSIAGKANLVYINIIVLWPFFGPKTSVCIFGSGTFYPDEVIAGK